MTLDGYKQVGEHVVGCHAQNDPDGLTFIVHRGDVWNLRKNGAKGGSTMWSRFACNDTRCKAEMLVRWDVLARCINAPNRGAA